jgi:hypothetical protein
MHYERFIHQRDLKEKQVYLVDMKEDKHTGIFSSLAEKTLQTYIPQKKRILIIGGKR